MSQDNLARIHPADPDAAAPALGMSIQVDLGAGRVATLQTFVPNDASLSAVTRMLAKMTAAGDHQRAHYQLESLRRDLMTEEKKLVQIGNDYAAAKKGFSAAQAQRLADVEKQQAAVSNFIVAKEAQRGEGRRGPVQLKGADAANVERLESSVKTLKEQIPQADLTFATDCENYEGSLRAQTKTIEHIKREIARCEEVVASGLVE